MSEASATPTKSKWHHNAAEFHVMASLYGSYKMGWGDMAMFIYMIK